MSEQKSIALDDFVFSLHTAYAESLEEDLTAHYSMLKPYKGESTPYFQSFEERKEIKGSILTTKAGLKTFDRIKEKIKMGEPMVMTYTDGSNMGSWYCSNLKESKPQLRHDGLPLQINFSLTLIRCPNETRSNDQK